MRLDAFHRRTPPTLPLAVVLAALCTPPAAQTTPQAAAPPAAVTANGPYYATPAWDQTFTANRFIVLANFRGEAVLDRETGLVWERTPRTMRNIHFSHLVGCTGQTTGGRYGWRLPTIDELSTLVDPSAAYPATEMPSGHPFALGEPSPAFWSSTIVTGLDGRRLALGLQLSPVSVFIGSASAEPPVEMVRAWCVRGGSR